MHCYRKFFSSVRMCIEQLQQTTARVKLHWKHPVLFTVTFHKKQSQIFHIMSIFFRKFKLQCHALMWRDRSLNKRLGSNDSAA